MWFVEVIRGLTRLIFPADNRFVWHEQQLLLESADLGMWFSYHVDSTVYYGISLQFCKNLMTYFNILYWNFIRIQSDIFSLSIAHSHSLSVAFVRIIYYLFIIKCLGSHPPSRVISDNDRFYHRTIAITDMILYLSESLRLLSRVSSPYSILNGSVRLCWFLISSYLGQARYVLMCVQWN